MSNQSSAGGLWAGVLGGTVFLVFFLVLSVPLWVSLLIAGASFGAGFLLVPRPQAADPDLSGALTEGRKKLAGLRRLGAQLNQPTVATEVATIAHVADRILGEAATDPRSLKKARPFLTYYLDSTVKILDLYRSLKSQGLEDEEIARTLARVEGMLRTIREAFEKLLARLLADDVLDLDTEIALLEQTIKMEGLSK